jgi:hypothetical protein
MSFPIMARVLDLHAAARRLRVPERTLRYRASRGRVPGAFKQGKLWKFPAGALESGGVDDRVASSASRAEPGRGEFPAPGR